jgi:hypothetical protein
MKYCQIIQEFVSAFYLIVKNPKTDSTPEGEQCIKIFYEWRIPTLLGLGRIFENSI